MAKISGHAVALAAQEDLNTSLEIEREFKREKTFPPRKNLSGVAVQYTSSGSFVDGELDTAITFRPISGSLWEQSAWLAVKTFPAALDSRNSTLASSGIASEPHVYRQWAASSTSCPAVLRQVQRAKGIGALHPFGGEIGAPWSDSSQGYLLVSGPLEWTKKMSFTDPYIFINADKALAACWRPVER